MSLTVKRKSIGPPHEKKPTPKPASLREWNEALDEQKVAGMRKRNGHVPPGMTSTTTPAGIAAHDPDVLRPPPAMGSGQTVILSLAICEPHPDNPRPTIGEVDQIRRSLDEDGQLEPIVVRPVRRLNDLRYQILSGETRWLAACELGWKTITAFSRDCDDATAVKLLAIYNAKRKTLDPIRKAQMIERLTKPAGEGGAGMTLEEAAKVYGLESASGASNLKRLLALPEAWQQRVISGELPESFARLLLPYAHAPRLMEAFDRLYVADLKSKHNYEREAWETRANMEHHLAQEFRDLTRPVEAGDDHYYDQDQIKPKAGDYRYNRSWSLLFKLTPELEAELDIHEFTVGKKKYRRATNCQLYDQHQIPAIKAKVDVERQKAAAKGGASADKTSQKPKSKAEIARREKELAEQLDRRIQGWRHKLLRCELIREIDDDVGCETGLRLVLAVWAHRPTQVHTWNLLEQVRGVDARHGDEWQLVGPIEGMFDEQATIAELAKRLLALEDRDPRQPILGFSLVESYAAAVEIDVAEAWKRIQPAGAKEAGTLFEEFFLLHGKDQLVALGKELGVHVGEAKTRDAMVKVFTSRDRLLPLPKSVAPLKRQDKGTKATKSRRAS
jgi:ParB/RepB/Spo0J family partition protein